MWVEGERLHPPPESQTGGNFALIFTRDIRARWRGKTADVDYCWLIAIYDAIEVIIAARYHSHELVCVGLRFCGFLPRSDSTDTRERTGDNYSAGPETRSPSAIIFRFIFQLITHSAPQ